MKTLLLILVILVGCANKKDKCPKMAVNRLPVHYCMIHTVYCNGICDTIYIKAYGTLCLARVEGDTSFNKLADGSNRVFRENVCDFKVLRHDTIPFEHE